VLSLIEVGQHVLVHVAAAVYGLAGEADPVLSLVLAGGALVEDRSPLEGSARLDVLRHAVRAVGFWLD